MGDPWCNLCYDGQHPSFILLLGYFKSSLVENAFKQLSNRFPYFKSEQDLFDPKTVFSLFSHVSFSQFSFQPLIWFSFLLLYHTLSGVLMMAEYSTCVWALPPSGLKWFFVSIVLFMPVKSFIKGGAWNYDIVKII